MSPLLLLLAVFPEEFARNRIHAKPERRDFFETVLSNAAMDVLNFFSLCMTNFNDPYVQNSVILRSSHI